MLKYDFYFYFLTFNDALTNYTYGFSKKKNNNNNYTFVICECFFFLIYIQNFPFILIQGSWGL